MDWFGWIPILSSELRPVNLECLPLDKREREVLGDHNVEGLDKLYVANREWLSYFEDRPTKIHRKNSASVIHDGSTPQYLISWKDHSSSDYRFFGQVLEIHYKRSMFKYQLIAPVEHSDEYARAFYRIIRDIYHIHIFTSSDSSIYPALASSYDEAAEMIWRNSYENGLCIEKKRRIKIKEEDAVSKKQKHELDKLVREIHHVLGQVIYGRSFIRLNSLGTEKRIILDQIQSCFEIMKENLQWRIDKRKENIAVYARYLAILASSITLYNLLQSFPCSLWLKVSLFCIAELLLFLILWSLEDEMFW